AVFASSEPAELMETQGEPDYATIEGTNLLRVKNTRSNVFVDGSTGESYVLVSGRWFKAPSRQGPWSFVAGKDLPAGFSKIPASSPAGEVLASVPSTPEAEEAVIANDLPETATITRSEAQLET